MPTPINIVFAAQTEQATRRAQDLLASLDRRLAGTQVAFAGLAGSTRKAAGAFDALISAASLSEGPLGRVAFLASNASFTLDKLGKAVGSIGFLRFGAFAGIALAVGGIATQGYKLREANQQLEASTASLTTASDRMAVSLERIITLRERQGALTSEEATNLRKLIPNRSERAFLGPGTSAEVLSGIATQARRQSGPIFSQEDADATRALAVARAEATAQVERARIAKELEVNQAAMDANERQLEPYLARRRQLAVESHRVEIDLVGKQEFELRNQLTLADEAGKKKVLAGIEGLHADRKVLDLRLEQELTRIAADGAQARQRIEEQKARDQEIARRDFLHAERLAADFSFEQERRLEEAKKEMRAAAVNSVATSLGQMAEFAKLFGKKGFAAYKALASAEALVKTYTSAVGAYSSVVGIPYVGPFLAVVAAAAATAAGLANVAAINRQNPSFAQGGLVSGPGSGTSDSILARLSNGEYVIPAGVVGNLGVGFFDSLRAGNEAAGSAPAAAPPSVSVGSPQVHVGVISSREAMRDFLESSDGRAIIYDEMRRRRTDLGLST